MAVSLSSELIVTAGSVEICTQSCGSAGDPPVLLIMGATASMLWWPDEFVRGLAEQGRFVVRYDHRDTGRSTTRPPGEASYTLDDLADDALAILNAYGIRQAHLFGMSMGGLLAQILAIRSPDRVASLVLMATEKLGLLDFEPVLISPDLMRHFGTAEQVDWSDREQVVAFLIESWRLTSGPGRRFDEARIRETARREFARTSSPLSAFNHGSLGGGEAFFNRQGEIGLPAVIIHGTEDPVVSYDHARALERSIAGAELLPLEGAGHEISEEDWPSILSACTRVMR